VVIFRKSEKPMKVLQQSRVFWTADGMGQTGLLLEWEDPPFLLSGEDVDKIVSKHKLGERDDKTDD